MLNKDIYVKDPLANQLANNGVAEVKDDNSEQALSTLKYELETFVCDGEYENNNYRLLDARPGWNYQAVPVTANQSL